MIAEFLTRLEVREHLPGEWVLTSLLQYRSAAGDLYGVPRGFVTDLASLPAVARIFIDRNGASRRAAVLHDWLYCLNAGERKDADDLFLEAMSVSGVGWLQRWTMYSAVRAAGWVYWNRRHLGLEVGRDFIHLDDDE